MKTAGWSTRRIADQVDRLECAVRNCWEQWTREGTTPTCGKQGLERPGRPRGERVERSCGKHLWTPQTFPKWSLRGNFQQDNARPHTARVAQEFLRHFQTLPWPARCPDLSPVEHVWDQLKRQMPSCHSVHDLELAVQDLWAHLPQDNIRCLINSMSDRVAAYIAAGGVSTRY
ncbi:uncharacterized protein TNCV_4380421 [Trichonephila clavipes]|nr:uncharacterized protein TNCV_4380421 [Trichonephila clavipes]